MCRKKNQDDVDDNHKSNLKTQSLILWHIFSGFSLSLMLIIATTVIRQPSDNAVFNLMTYFLRVFFYSYAIFSLEFSTLWHIFSVFYSHDIFSQVFKKFSWPIFSGLFYYYHDDIFSLEFLTILQWQTTSNHHVLCHKISIDLDVSPQISVLVFWTNSVNDKMPPSPTI